MINQEENKTDLDNTNPADNSTTAANTADADLANDPILGGSSINSEDYWFLKLSNMQ